MRIYLKAHCAACWDCLLGIFGGAFWTSLAFEERELLWLVQSSCRGLEGTECTRVKDHEMLVDCTELLFKKTFSCSDFVLINAPIRRAHVDVIGVILPCALCSQRWTTRELRIWPLTILTAMRVPSGRRRWRDRGSRRWNDSGGNSSTSSWTRVRSTELEAGSLGNWCCRSSRSPSSPFRFERLLSSSLKTRHWTLLRFWLRNQDWAQDSILMTCDFTLTSLRTWMESSIKT